MVVENLWPKWLALIGVPALAFFVYGSWAAYANSDHGYGVALRSGLGQGIYAFFSTWLITYVAQLSFLRLGKGKTAGLMGFSVSVALMLFIPLSVHAAIQTPNVWQAITPGLVWGAAYVAVFLWHLYRREQQLQAQQLSL